MPKHYLIFIHGIGELNDEETPSQSYEMLWERIIKESGQSREAFEQHFGRIDVVWHVGQLQKAEKALFEASFFKQKPGWLNPMGSLRSFMTFFVGDVAAYVSEDVNFIRRTVWEQIWRLDRNPSPYVEPNKTFKQLLEEGATYSIVAHSLGTVITFDYLFGLFHPKEPKLFVPCPDSERRPEDGGLEGKDYELAEATDYELGLLQNGFRHFFSMGSPITLFLMRKGSLWAEGEPFKEVYNPVRPVPENSRVWCNFWDSDDPIAYPVARLFNKNPENNECKLLDVPVETGLIFSAHVDYWKNRTVAKEIANWIIETD